MPDLITEREAVLKVAAKFKKQYYNDGHWDKYEWKPKKIYLQIKKLSSLNAVDRAIGNNSWTKKIKAWHNKDRIR